MAVGVIAAGVATGAPGPRIFVGTYSQRGSEGIYGTRLDLGTGALQTPRLAAPATNASFLAYHPSRRFLYAVNEVGKLDGKPAGGVVAYAVDAGEGVLTALNLEVTGGPVPCHLAADATGSRLVVANYADGTVAMFPVRPDGRLGPVGPVIRHEGAGPNAKRQQGPHAHGVTFDPANRFVFVPDLGIDRIMGYRFDPKADTLAWHEPASPRVAPGAGPRHFAFHPTRPFAYAVNELDCTVTAFAWDAKAGALKPFASAKTLPADFARNNTCAEIAVHPNGRFLYASNRGHDSLAVFALGEDGTPAPLQHQPCGGRTPRNFALDPSGAFLVCANQDSDNLVVFRVDPATGRLAPAGAEVRVPAPVCVLFP